jgi:hypothetical protein
LPLKQHLLGFKTHLTGETASGLGASPVLTIKRTCLDPKNPPVLTLKMHLTGWVASGMVATTGEGSFGALHVMLEGFSFSHLWEKVARSAG